MQVRCQEVLTQLELPIEYILRGKPGFTAIYCEKWSYLTRAQRVIKMISVVALTFQFCCI